MVRWPARVCAALALFVVTHGARASAARDTPILLGVHHGNQGWDLEAVRRLERWQGRPHDVLVLFTNWDADRRVLDNLFEHQLVVTWRHGAVPMITWEPFLASQTPSDIVSRIAGGEFDPYIATWATRLRQFLSGRDRRLGTDDDRRAYLRLAHEMNGNWYPWGQRAPQRFVAMWRRVHRIVAETGITSSQLQWVWTVTNQDHGPFDAEAYYPGDAWVDWLGLDGYNWGAVRPGSRWETPSAVLEPMLERLRRLAAKPIALTEVATTSLTRDGDDFAAKNLWIREYFQWVQRSGVRMACWYNLDRDAEFAVFGGIGGDVLVEGERRTTRAFSAYRQGVLQWPPTPGRGGARLISDASFAGQ